MPQRAILEINLSHADTDDEHSYVTQSQPTPLAPYLRVLPQPAQPAASSPLPRRAIALIAAAALVTSLAYAGQAPDLANQDWAAVVLIAALGMIAERFDINLYGESRLSVSVLFMIMAAVTLGPGAVLMVCPAIAIAGHVARGRPLYKLIFNTSLFVLGSLASAYVYAGLLHASPYQGRPIQAAAMVVAATANFGVSSLLVAMIIGYTANLPVNSVWREKFAWLVPHYAAFGLLAFPLTLGYTQLGAFGVLGFVAPVLMSRFTMKQYVDRTERTVTELRKKQAEVEGLSHELTDAYNETITALVSALDTRDAETHGHSLRVAELSLALGRDLGIAEGSREWVDLKHGALLHDVGKIGVPDAILRKPGSLTDSEWEAIREHPAHGHKMLRSVQFLSGAADLVYAHHERFDGEGYPRRLAGDDIPLGARIFAVADAFDAITSERPYKLARSEAEACVEIRKHSGTQFDPRVVATLMRALGVARAA